MRQLLRWLPYTLLFTSLGLVFIYLSNLPPKSVGDGNEYYALYYAWLETHRPWMSPSSYASFQALVDSREVLGLLSAEHLAATFPDLLVGKTADFNHFWFYSFLAFGVSGPLQVLGIFLSAHQSFLLLHFTLLLVVFITLYRLYDWQGIAAATIMTMISPMLWYLDKVHTELFTFVFALLAVAFVHRRRFLAGAFCLAMAATQNPSFALIALIPFFYRIVLLRDKPLSTLETLLAIGTAVLVLLHPSYYFIRYEVPTPQLLAGGASLGGNLSLFYIWLIDPDLGLLPYWPLGAIFILLALFILKQRRIDSELSESMSNWFFFVFIAAYLLVNFYSHSSTTNLNSGATAGPARYALWYLPVFLPVLLFVLNNLAGRKILLYLCVCSVALSAWFNLRLSDPRKPQDYSTPSYLSLFIQTHFSSFYSPPEEVFAERYSGFGELVHGIAPRAILGPDCSKVLLFPGGDRYQVTAPKCVVNLIEFQKVANLLTLKLPNDNSQYAWLNSEQKSKILLRLVPGKYLVGQGGNGNFAMSSGWGEIEQFGVWSDGSHATLSLPCSAQHFYFKRDFINLSLHVQPYGNQTITVRHEKKTVYHGEISSESDLDFEINTNGCRNTALDLDIHVAEPRSPFDLGQSNDGRKLGVYLLSYRLS